MNTSSPFNHQLRRRRRRSRRGDVASILAYLGLFFLLLAMMKNMAYIAQTRSLEQLHAKEEASLKSKAGRRSQHVQTLLNTLASFHRVPRQGEAKNESVPIVPRATAERRRYALQAAHEMEHGGDEMTLYRIRSQKEASTRGGGNSTPSAKKILGLVTDKPNATDTPTAAPTKSPVSLEANFSETQNMKQEDAEVEIERKTQSMVESTSPIKCSLWEVSLDSWWQDHPDWEPSLENDTHTCFTPMANQERAAFYRQVHALQFPEPFSDDHAKRCSLKKGPQKLVVRQIHEHGYAATLLHFLGEGIWSAYRENRTFQFAHPHQGFRWPYIPPQNQSSWAWCPSQDPECYFLPLSSCQHPFAGSKEEEPKKKHLWGDTEPNKTLWEQNIWMTQFVMRPRQVLRKHFYEFWKHADIPTLETPCTMMHVRRSDAMSEAGYDRNFYSIQEYLDRGNIAEGESILLLTDDQSAIEEATLLHPQYKWTYWNRTRNRGPSAYNSHFPSHSEVLEVLIILAEKKLAGQCQNAVYGKSNMARFMRNEAVIKQGPNVTWMEIDKRLRKTRVEADDFMKNLDARLAAARAKASRTDNAGESNQEPEKKSPPIKPTQQTHDVLAILGSSQILTPVPVGDFQIKCSPWNINIDDWWQDHPDWEPSVENSTHTCFSPIANLQRAEFLRQVHATQFPQDLEKGCSLRPRDPKRMAVRQTQVYGFASTFLHLLNEGLWSAFREGRVFRHAPPYENFRWLYEPKDNRSWASCPSHDHECYYLPTSSCPRPPVGSKEEAPKKKFIYREVASNETLMEQYIWLSHYIMRPRQELRHRFLEFWNKAEVPKLDKPCTWFHVRRGDAMTEKGYDRNFYPIREYLQRSDAHQGESILLLTDDRSAIEEATLLHPGYNWSYWNRTRNRGPSAYNSHIPSNDEILEVLIIMAEQKLASQCRKGVFGKSNMARLFRNAMVVEHGSLANLTLLEIDGKLRKTRVDAGEFMKDLDAKLSGARSGIGGMHKR